MVLVGVSFSILKEGDGAEYIFLKSDVIPGEIKEL
jgi:hypothetical protein